MGAFLALSVTNDRGADLPPIAGPPSADAVATLAATFGEYGVAFELAP